MYLFWTYRPRVIWWSYNLENNLSLNWTYTPSFFLDWQFADYKAAWLTKILDTEIPEDRYTWEIAPWFRKLTRFIMAYYNEDYIIKEDFEKSVSSVGSDFKIEIFWTIEEAKIWIRNNTDLQEVSEWKFLIYPETTWINWEVIEAKFLTIE